MKKFLSTSLIMLVVTFAIAGCGNNNKPTGTNQPPPPGKAVAIQGFAFSPSNLTIAVGDTVVWTNHDATPHTSTSNTGLWNSGSLGVNQTYSRVFSSAGAFPYHCTFHPNMIATITVQ